MSKMDSAICPRVGNILIEDRKNNVGRAPEVRYILKKNQPTKSHKKRLSFWESLLKNEWDTYFLLGNGDGFGHYFLVIFHFDFLLHLFVD
jgi:hypothetical protein